jgi:hypothetical protein
VVRIPMATPMATSGRFCELTHVGKLRLTRVEAGGSKQTRTADPFLVREVLYQLSYAPGSLSP